MDLASLAVERAARKNYELNGHDPECACGGGCPLIPPWESLDETEREAWRASTHAVVDAYNAAPVNGPDEEVAA